MSKTEPIGHGRPADGAAPVEPQAAALEGAGSHAVLPSGEGLPLELRILQLFERPEVLLLGPTDISRMLPGVSKGAASPKLKNLAQAGYLQREGDGYAMGPRMATLYLSYLGRIHGGLLMLKGSLDGQVNTMLSLVKQLQAIGGQA